MDELKEDKCIDCLCYGCELEDRNIGLTCIDCDSGCSRIKSCKECICCTCYRLCKNCIFCNREEDNLRGFVEYCEDYFDYRG